jgi:hypothetical protein
MSAFGQKRIAALSIERHLYETCGAHEAGGIHYIEEPIVVIFLLEQPLDGSFKNAFYRDCKRAAPCPN